jgi:hypothetical protein
LLVLVIVPDEGGRPTWGEAWAEIRENRLLFWGGVVLQPVCFAVVIAWQVWHATTDLKFNIFGFLLWATSWGAVLVGNKLYRKTMRIDGRDTKSMD